MPRRERGHLRPRLVPPPRDGSAATCRSGLTVGGDRTVARWHGLEVLLGPREEDLLALLVRHPERLLTYEELASHVWGGTTVSRDAVTATVKRVRGRLRSLGLPDVLLATVHGLGYRWNPDALSPWEHELDPTG